MFLGEKVAWKAVNDLAGVGTGWTGSIESV